MLKLQKYLLYINLIFLQSYLIRFDIGPYPSNLQEILIAAMALASAPTIIKNISKLPRYWITLSLITLTGISTLVFWPGLNQIDLLRHIKFVFFASAFSLSFFHITKSEKATLKALKIAGLGALLFGIYSIAHNLSGHNVALDGRLRGPLDSAVYLAFYLAPFTILYFCEFFKNRERRDLLIALALAILLIGTKSMGAIGSTFLITAYYLISKTPLLEKKKWKYGLGILGLIIFVTIFYTKILPTLNTSYSSLDERGQIWITATELLKNSKNFILGLGPNQFQAHYAANVANVLGKEPLDYIVLQPHNIFFLFWFHYGIFGLGLLLFLIYRITTNLLKTREISSYTLTFTLMLSYFFIHGLIDTPFFKNDLLIIFLVLSELSLNKKLFQPSN